VDGIVSAGSVDEAVRLTDETMVTVLTADEIQANPSLTSKRRRRKRSTLSPDLPFIGPAPPDECEYGKLTPH